MSYLHCPACHRAYNIAVSAACPSCPVAAIVVDASEDIVAAAEQLARAMARATPTERAAATARMDRLALPAPGAKPATFHGAMIKSIREAIAPTAPPPLSPRATPGPRLPLMPRLALVAHAMLDRLAPRAPRLEAGLRAAAARVKALAA